MEYTKREIATAIKTRGDELEYMTSLVQSHPDVIGLEMEYTNIRAPLIEVRLYVVVPVEEGQRNDGKHFHLTLKEPATTMRAALRVAIERWTTLDYEHMRAMHGEDHVCKHDVNNGAEDLTALLSLLAAPNGPPS